MFVFGFLHCDPHPGNILIRPHPSDPTRHQTVLIDHGLYIEMRPEFREQYAELWRGLMQGDLSVIEVRGDLLVATGRLMRFCLRSGLQKSGEWTPPAAMFLLARFYCDRRGLRPKGRNSQRIRTKSPRNQSHSVRRRKSRCGSNANSPSHASCWFLGLSSHLL